MIETVQTGNRLEKITSVNRALADHCGDLQKKRESLKIVIIIKYARSNGAILALNSSNI